HTSLPALAEAAGEALTPARETVAAAGLEATGATEGAEQVLEIDAARAAGGEAHVLGAAATAEHLGEDVLEAATGAAGTAGGEARAAAHRADRVVLLALLGVGEDRVGLADVLELLLRRFVTRLGVRVPLARELAVGLLQRLLVDVLGDAEDRVEVLVHPVLADQRSSPPSSLLDRGRGM